MSCNENCACVTAIPIETPAVYDFGKAYQAETNAQNSANAAARSAETAGTQASKAENMANTATQKAIDASNSATQAAASAQQAMSGTPSGYAALVDKVASHSAEIVAKADGIECETDTVEINVANDCSNLPLRKLVVEGRSEQKQYQGYNLLNLKAFADKYPSYCVWNEATQTLSVTSTQVLYATGIELNLPKDNYIYSAKIANETSSGARLQLIDENGDVIPYLNSSIESVSFSSGISRIRLDWSSGGRFTINNAMLRLTSAPTDYEPYVGGMPSPSPEYPQAIESVGDSGELVETVHSKNLLDNDSAILDKWIYEVSGNVMSDTETKYYPNYIPIKPNEILTLSNKLIPNMWFSIACYDKNKNIISSGIQTNLKNNVYRFASSNKNIAYIRVSIAKSADTAQLEYGSNATDYVEGHTHSATIVLTEPLRSIGDIHDTLTINADGSGVIERKIASANFANTSWQLRYSGTKNKTYSTVLSKKFNKNTLSVLCSDYKYIRGVEGVSELSNPDNCIVGIYGYANENATNDQSSMYVVGENIPKGIACYAMFTPTYEQLTPAQTQAFLQLHSNKLTTVAYNSDNAKQSITYVADTKKYLDNKFDELKNAIISLGGNV